jgi:hypothetical protein
MNDANERMTRMVLRYWVFERSAVERLTANRPIPSDFLRTWEAARPGVLDDSTQDVFAENSRSHRQQWSRYGLFSRDALVDADFVVCQNWCELFEAGGVRENIAPLFEALTYIADGKPIITSWNHDRDEATVPEFQSLPQNVVVLAYNTSKPTANDLLVPFWNITTTQSPNTNQNRQWKASFIGQAHGDLRKRLRYAFQNRPGYYFSDERRPEPEYLEVMRDSWFALCPRGGGLSSYRMFEAIQCESILVLFADDYALPFTDILDWRSFCVRIPERLAGDFGAVEAMLDAVDRDAMIAALWRARRELSLEAVQLAIVDRIKGMLTT